MMWHTRGRDVAVPLVADYLSEPPDDLPAGVVGTLVDEQADMKYHRQPPGPGRARRDPDRGETGRSTWGFGVSRDHIFHLVDKNGQLHLP